MNFPRQSIPENKKNEQWHKDNIRSIVLYHSDYGIIKNERVKDHENYQLVDGIFDHKQFKYMTDMYGITAPARLVNWPMIGSRLELLAGELLSQGFEFSTNVINREAIARKNEKKMGIATETVLRPIRREMEQMIGMKIPDEDVGEEIPKDVEEYSNYKFREANEVNIHYGLQYLIQKYNLEHVFKRGFYDLGIVNKEFYKIYVKQGDPFVKRVDPRNMIWDKDSDEEFIQNSGYAGDQTWYTINEVIDRFKLSKQQVSELEDLATKQREHFDELNGGFQWYRFDDGGNMTVCVTEMQWRSIRMMNYKVSKNPYDNETPFYKLLPEDYKMQKDDNVESYGITDVRKGILIGHDMLIEWGRKPNQYRPEENYQKTTLDYYGVVKNNFTGVTLSVVDALKNIQIFKNIVMYHIEKALASSGGKAVVYDVSQKPVGVPLEDVFYHLKNTGLILINSKQEGNKFGGPSFNQFQQVDFTLSNSLQQLINIAGMLDETADRMTGISAARSGINKSGDLVGVNERNVMQSTLITAPLYECHYALVSQVMNGLANLMPMAWPEGKMVNIFGDTGMMTWKISKDIAFDEYGIFVRNNAKDIQDRKMMIGLIQNYSNNGAIDPLAAIRAVRMTSPTEIENVLEQGMKAVKAAQLQMEQAKNEELKRANDIAEATNKMKMDIAQLQADTDIQVAKINNEGQVIKTDQLMRGQREATGMKIDGKLREVEMNNIAKEKEKFSQGKSPSKPKPTTKKPEKK